MLRFEGQARRAIEISMDVGPFGEFAARFHGSELSRADEAIVPPVDLTGAPARVV